MTKKIKSTDWNDTVKFNFLGASSKEPRYVYNVDNLKHRMKTRKKRRTK